MTAFKIYVTRWGIISPLTTTISYFLIKLTQVEFMMRTAVSVDNTGIKNHKIAISTVC